MPKEFIITMTATNRAGILSAVTKAMEELGADLRECSQTVVRGFFTMIFSAEFPENVDPGIIRDHLNDVGRPFGIDVGVKDPQRELPSSPNNSAHQTHALRLGGRNQPGALRRLSAVISMRRVDITGMHAVRTADGGGFEMVMKIAVPADFDLDRFLADLNEIGRSFHITADISDYS